MRALTRSGHRVEVLRAPAGAGKTFALDAAREVWERSGNEVVGCALSAQAARELREHAGIDTTTIADLKHRLDHGHRLPENGVLIVDEAGMVGTRDLATLDVRAQHTNTKLLLVGDDRQLPEIEAGGAFRALAERDGGVELTEVHRQRDDWDRDALNSLRVALGHDPATIAQDAGHADMAVTFRIYTHVMRLQEGDREGLPALVHGGVLAPNGTGAPDEGSGQAPYEASRNDETPGSPGASVDSWGETRTPDLTIMRPVQEPGEKTANAADAGESADPPDAQMRFDLDG